VLAGHPAAEVEIPLAVVVDQDRRVEEPVVTVGSPRNRPVDERVPDGVDPGSDRGAGLEDADAGSVVREVEEELVLAVNGLVRRGRRPRLGGPRRRAAWSGHLDGP